MINLEKITGLVHLYLQEVVQAGDVAVDATAGNGNDTLFLAHRVGENGKVYAFDIQEQALKITEQKLKEAGVAERAVFILDSHEKVLEYVRVPIKAAVFNLGYLPGGDKSIVTKPSTTITGLAECYKLLLPGGIITVTVYVGHAGGEEERMVIEEFSQRIPDREGYVIKHEFLNRPQTYPKLYIIGKRRSTVENSPSEKNS
ncbi:tRNA (mnm(5)s(2)U34)-methyltransferase [Carboxydothermus ferrireducens]|uniref:rRNA methylase n=1 Tax=Carboxydothermus ferrireducens DSM 11255 TaxID=1119529 RepID=A0ABX2RCF1_9THEO|nr:class I SAM-dependent methyltransferase [Carboxydothermus ferrireducens]NYE58695.1 hypothetical protein [Carboxydothermus ferrireducens DSM 11255]